MAILRNKNKEGYTVIPQQITNDQRLSLRDIGLLVKLLSLPDNWEFTEEGLEKVLPRDGITSVRSGLKALMEAGYLKRGRERDSSGKLGPAEWIVTDTPNLEKPRVGKPPVGNPPVEKPILENPRLDKPRLEKPILENLTQYKPNGINTKLQNTKELNTNAIEIDSTNRESIEHIGTIPPSLSPPTATSLIDEANLGEVLRAATLDWIRYKKERREGYRETGLKSLLTQIKKSAEQYGEQAVANIIQLSMSSNYKGIVFDRLEKEKAAEKSNDRLAWIWEVNLDDQ